MHVHQECIHPSGTVYMYTATTLLVNIESAHTAVVTLNSNDGSVISFVVIRIE